MKEEHSLDDTELSDVDLTGRLSSTHLADNFTADKLLDELTSLPQHHSLYSNMANASRNTYDQFFEEVSLDLPRQQEQEQTTPPRLMKFIPRRANSNQVSNSNNSSQANVNSTETSSLDGVGPFYSISNVLDDASNNNSSTGSIVNIEGRESGDYESIDVNNPTNPRAARRNVNEAEVVATSGGTSIGPVRRRSM